MPLTSKRQTKIAHDFASKSAWLMGADFLVQKIRIPDWCGAATKNETKIKGTPRPTKNSSTITSHLHSLYI
jgi:hypothetical protein